MTVHHLLGSEDHYIITSDRRDGDTRRGHRNGSVSLHTPRVEARAEVCTLPKGGGFGYGFQLGRNGGESHLGLDLYAGPLGSLWLRIRSPWTKWARVREGRPERWHARHTGLRLLGYPGCIVEVTIEDVDGVWRRDQPWWRSMKLTTTSILGRTSHESEVTGAGPTNVAMPEGVYAASWKRTAHVTRYVRLPGTLIDRLRGPRKHASMEISVPGGIPVEGKGENSWDCGMDGVFSTSGPDDTVADACERLAASVVKQRQRHGGPHDLTRPTTVTEASAR